MGGDGRMEGRMGVLNPVMLSEALGPSPGLDPDLLWGVQAGSSLLPEVPASAYFINESYHSQCCEQCFHNHNTIRT